MEKLGQFAKDITRVSQEVGTEGKLGGQALVLDVEGTCRELTAVFSKLAENSTTQVRSITKVTKDLNDTVHGMVARLRALAAELTRVPLQLGSQGRLGGQAHVPNMEGVRLNLVRNVNRMSPSLTDQVRSISVVTTAIARGDLTQKIEISVEGFVGGVNSMVDQLSAFAFEVTSVALEVGTQKLRKLFFVNVDVQEMLDVKTTVNSMAAQLGTLANEVTQVGLEVRREGILGGQAVLPNVQGMWKALTDSVNLMAMNLTNQVRSIAEVAKAVSGGDLTKTMSVEGSWN
ncbi:hypothetical protein BYT27DRAFT_7252732 [Phlegmacium glaucopus]|nr:hypothetical protein BYT27DRAFT_7252732 [Phlegmacium glaucopus]